MDLPSPFSSNEPTFDTYDEYAPDSIPEPGSHLEGHDVLTDEDHLAFHRLTRALFEERNVYDMTFGYNLARLNLDPRHTDAGYRYAESADEDDVLIAAFTPTTPFCPQSDTLAIGSFRAWNGLSDRHEYDLVRVRVADSHHRSEEINEQLRAAEDQFQDTGTLPDPRDPAAAGDPGAESQAQPDESPL